jgi:VIT1/CCC1 family predicted Fe2+/Mn2+ transporter
MRGHRERHRSANVGWLRAAVLGANDGILSTASLILGVAGSGSSRGAVLVAGLAGLVAGAMSMAAGEYVSVSSQADAEQADLDVERRELAANPAGEREELARIYRGRGVDRKVAREVAEELMEHDALAAHARDELGITSLAQPHPVQAAAASAASFASGAIFPVALAYFFNGPRLAPVLGVGCLLLLALLGGLAAREGGAPVTPGVVRVTFWGAVAMAITYGAGALFGASGA